MDSQKAPKEMGTCSVCWTTFRIQRATGFTHKHGPRQNPCPGSDKPPSTVQTSQFQFSSEQTVVATCATDNIANTVTAECHWRQQCTV